MSWRDAPLYVEANDLACWVVARANTWTKIDHRHLALLVTRGACELVSEVALALTFPDTRSEHLQRADHEIVRLRMLLRLACQLKQLRPGGLRFAAERLEVIGRMVGGWRKRVAKGALITNLSKIPRGVGNEVSSGEAANPKGVASQSPGSASATLGTRVSERHPGSVAIQDPNPERVA